MDGTPIFLSIEQVMTILMGEMPNGLYAEDRADSPDLEMRSFSSTEIRAHAQFYADLYANLQDIWENKFLSTVQPDGIGSWETDLFSTSVDQSQSFDTRKQNALTKYRSRGGLSLPYTNNLVSSILTPVGLTFNVGAFNGKGNGGWVLDTTALDLGTFLSIEDPLLGTILTFPYALDCNALLHIFGTTTSGSPNLTSLLRTDNIQIGAGVTGTDIPSGTTVVSKTTHALVMSHNATASHVGEPISIENYIVAGLTQQQFEDIQETAYTYAVWIYGNASNNILSTLDQVLTANEKAGSTHIIINNAPLPPDPNILDLGAIGLGGILVDAIDCGSALIGASYDPWDFSL